MPRGHSLPEYGLAWASEFDPVKGELACGSQDRAQQHREDFMRISFLSPLAALLLGSSAAAFQVTNASLNIGGPNSCSSEGFNDPGKLADGVTVATAKFDFTLDAGTNTLTLVVTNTSPVTVGVLNPLITQIYFNAPVQVTGMTLTNQTAAVGTPAFSLTFDANLMANPNPNGADGFGAFSAALDNPNGVNGAIANAAADTVAGSPVTGPATFTFSLTGNLAGVTATDFTSAFSVVPPGNKPAHGVCHFQAGGPQSSSAFISDGSEQCFLVRGQSPGNQLWGGIAPSGHQFQTQIGGVVDYFGVTMESPFMVELPPITGPQKGRRFERQVLQRFAVQVFMWNPDDFPGNPEQYTPGIDVTIYTDGFVRTVPFGSNDNIDIQAEVVNLVDGRTFLTFPFQIDFGGG
jgi:hypothetical protein